METSKAYIASSATQEGGEVNTPNDTESGMGVARWSSKSALAAPSYTAQHTSHAIEGEGENDKTGANTTTVLSPHVHGERHLHGHNSSSSRAAVVTMTEEAARRASILAGDALPPYLRHRNAPAMLLAGLKLPTRADATRLNQVVRARIATLRAEIAFLHTLMRKTNAQQELQHAVQQPPRSIFSMLYATLIEMPLHVLLQLGSQCWYICRHLWQQWRDASSILYLWHTTCNPLALA